MQIILLATHGIVSGTPDYFKRAFGDTTDEFESILLHPHDYIFNREWYERHDGRQELYEYREGMEKLTLDDRAELVALLSSCDPRNFVNLRSQTLNDRIKRVLPFYVPKAKDELLNIWARQKAIGRTAMEVVMADDERVEDAGLDQDIEVLPIDTSPKVRRRAAEAIA
jgi:hypothetical protein